MQLYLNSTQHTISINGIKNFACLCRCSVEYDKDEGIATLTIKDIKRSDAGNYHVTVKNSVGLDEMELRVDVLSAPSIPKGTKNCCFW